MRVLLYARYSMDLQDPLSIDTQLTMCRRELAQRKWTEVGCYTDGAQSGATIHRAGLQALLAAVGTGGVDVVFADAMDRVSRSQADIASLYERLKFRGILLVTRRRRGRGAANRHDGNDQRRTDCRNQLENSRCSDQAARNGKESRRHGIWL